MSYRILGGDCVARMGMLNPESIDNILTDPPYEIGFMGKGWDSSGVAYNPKTWKAAHRVLKPNGLMLVFGATRTHHRIAHAIERAGFEIIDIIAWTYGTGFPKSHNISKAIDKRGGKDVSWFGAWFKKWRLENKITMKSVGEHFLSKNGKVTGCVFNWEEGCSLPTNKQFNKLCSLYKLPFSSMDEAKRIILKEDIRYRGSDSWDSNGVGMLGKGRQDHSITASATEPAKQWEGWGTALKPAWEPIIIARKKGSSRAVENYSQFHYISKASKKEKNAGLEDSEPQKMGRNQSSLDGGKILTGSGNERSNVKKNFHPTVKPIKLMKVLVEEFTEEGSIVFDPFTGSGSTGIASVLLNREFIGCELTPEYIPLAKARIEYAINDGALFE